MRNDHNPDLQRAHAYLDQLPSSQVTAVRGLLEAMLDPVSIALANAADEDEAISEVENAAVAQAKAAMEHEAGIPFEEVLAKLGMSMEEVTGSRER